MEDRARGLLLDGGVQRGAVGDVERVQPRPSATFCALPEERSSTTLTS